MRARLLSAAQTITVAHRLLPWVTCSCAMVSCMLSSASTAVFGAYKLS